MFFSINSPQLSVVHPELRSLVLSKNKQGILPKKFGVYLYLLTGDIMRYIGIASILQSKSAKNIIRVLSELSAPPFGYVFEMNPKEKKEYCDITFFANNFLYNQPANLTLKIPIYESNTGFPADYRTKKEILNEYIKHKVQELGSRK